MQYFCSIYFVGAIQMIKALSFKSNLEKIPSNPNELILIDSY